MNYFKLILLLLFFVSCKKEITNTEKTTKETIDTIVKKSKNKQKTNTSSVVFSVTKEHFPIKSVIFDEVYKDTSTFKGTVKSIKEYNSTNGNFTYPISKRIRYNNFYHVSTTNYLPDGRKLKEVFHTKNNISTNYIYNNKFQLIGVKNHHPLVENQSNTRIFYNKENNVSEILSYIQYKNDSTDIISNTKITYNTVGDTLKAHQKTLDQYSELKNEYFYKKIGDSLVVNKKEGKDNEEFAYKKYNTWRIVQEKDKYSVIKYIRYNNGAINCVKRYHPNGESQKGRTCTTYHTNDKLEIIRYDAPGYYHAARQEEEYNYNGDLIKTLFYRGWARDDYPYRTTKYQYEYDKFGNWTSKKKLNDNNEIIEYKLREIEYYNNDEPVVFDKIETPKIEEIKKHQIISEESDTIYNAYLSIEAYEISATAIQEVKVNNNLKLFQGDYHFGESEGESTLSIIYSNGKFYANESYGEWSENEESWVAINKRLPCKYENDILTIGKTQYKLYQVMQNTVELALGDLGIVSKFYEEEGPYCNLQFNYKSPLIIYGKYPETYSVKLTEEDLKNYTKSELQIMRNEIIARHGHEFKLGGKMEEYFSKQNWYKYKYFYKGEGYGYSASNLSEIEKHNINTIQKVEQKK